MTLHHHAGLLTGLSVAASFFFLTLLIRCCCVAQRAVRRGHLDMVAEMTPERGLEEEDYDHEEEEEEEVSSEDTAAAAAVAVEMTEQRETPEEWRPPQGLSPSDADYRNKFIRGGL